MSKKLPVGKLDMDMLKGLIDRHAVVDSRVLLGPKIGEDAAVIDFGESCLVVKTDPVTFATEEVGWYLVHVNANDIACTGAIPKWLLVTILLPGGTADESAVEEIFSQISEACQSINVSLIGGHTEVTQAVSRPIVVGQMLGEVAKDGLVASSGAKPWDEILLTKGIAIEGVALLAREKESHLLQRGYEEEFIEKCKDFIYRPGISILDEALTASRVAEVSAMHDPTESGLSMGIAELAEASGTGAEVYLQKINVYEECRILCREFNLDPLGVIASGSLLITAPPDQANLLLKEFDKLHIECNSIGRITEREKKLVLITPEGARPLPVYAQDEVTRAL